MVSDFNFKKGTGIVAQPYGGLLYNKDENIYDVINNMGYCILKSFDNEKSIDSIYFNISELFDLSEVDKEEIFEDINRFIGLINRKGYLTTEEHNSRINPRRPFYER